MKNVGNSSRGRSQGVPKIFGAPMYMAHCAVIFATAQLSCLIHVSLTRFDAIRRYSIFVRLLIFFIGAYKSGREREITPTFSKIYDKLHFCKKLKRKLL